MATEKPQPLDLTTLSDEDLHDMAVAVNDELKRRRALTDIPNQIERLTLDYEARGGDVANLAGSIDAEAIKAKRRDNPEDAGRMPMPMPMWNTGVTGRVV